MTGSDYVRFAAKTDKGMQREINEDSYSITAGCDGVPQCFIIADGMGGHNSGEIASKTAVDFVVQAVRDSYQALTNEESAGDAISEIIIRANQEVYRKSLELESYNGMGTTLILATILNNRLFVGHIGDSRVYVINGGGTSQVTVDHSYIEELIRTGSLSREEAENHPNKNIITRALGCAESIEVDLLTRGIAENDIVLICTDGLSNMLSDEEIRQIVQNNDDPELACTGLVKASNEKGGVDNITVILVKV